MAAACQQSRHQAVTKTQAGAEPIANKAAVGSLHRKGENEEMSDSLRELAIIRKILAYGTKHIGTPFKGRGLDAVDSTIILSYGHLFDGVKNHLLVYNEPNHYTVCLHVFEQVDSHFNQLISAETEKLGFTDYHVKDINGDGLLDFVYNYYPSSGCCARDVNVVYLYHSSGGFSDPVEFVNPAFSPKEKLIRGVEYGHSGEVPLYKFRWHGNKIDTIELIYPADTLKKRFYRVHHYGDEIDPHKRQVLTKIPSEYKKINGYQWFIDY
ncbi:hypothetical protein ABZR88_20180 [Mucilaginibacter yixingensis]|nr:hypothetical protein [Mucilaginibacter yixingensis]